MTGDSAHTEPMPARPRVPRVAVAAIAVLIGAAFWWTFRWMVMHWERTGSYYGHGWLIWPISLGLLWLRRREIAAAPRRTCLWGLAVLVPSLLVHLLATAWQVGFLSGFALLGVLVGLVLVLFGPAVLRRCLFPIAFLAFMVPLPDVLVETLSFRLKLLAAAVATGLSNLANIPAVREGSYIHVQAGTLIVDDVCSGLKYLISLTAFGALYAYLSRLRPALKVVLFVLALPVAFLANVARVTLMLFVADAFGIGQAEEWYFHDLFGFVLFATALLLLFGAETLLLLAFGRPDAPDEAARPSAVATVVPEAGASGRQVTWRSARALAWGLTLGLVVVAGASTFLAWPRAAAPATNVWASVPTQLGSWQGRDGSLTDHEYGLLGTHDVLVRSYTNGLAGRVQLVIVLAQQARRRTHPPEQCLTGEGYRLEAVGEQRLPLQAAGPDGLSVGERVFKHGEGARVVWYFYKSGPRLSTSYWRHQVGVAFRKLTDPNAADVLVRLDAEVPASQIEEARKQLRDFLTQAAGPLLKHLP